MLCRQRIGLHSWADSSSSQSAAAVCCRASTLATTGISASWKVMVARILRSRLRAGAMNGVWKAAAHRDRATPCGRPARGRERSGPGDRVGLAGDHGLLGAVEVGDPHLAVGQPAGDVDGVGVAVPR